jgi:hypothetical protein
VYVYPERGKQRKQYCGVYEESGKAEGTGDDKIV